MAQHYRYGKKRQHKHPAKQSAIAHEWPEPVYNMVLVMGGWKKNYTELALQVLLANALNACSKHRYFVVVAYLITGKRLGLVLKQQAGKDMASLLRLLYQEVAKQMRQVYGLAHRSPVGSAAPQGEQDRPAPALFRVFVQYNVYMDRLMTARPVHSMYYDPHIARVTAMVKGHRFCSAIDYNGGKGPVAVRMLRFEAE